MTLQEQEILESLQRQYDVLHEKLPMYLAPSSGCSVSQKTEFANAVNQALLNLATAQNNILGRDEGLIQKISTDVLNAEQEITDSLSSLANIARCMDQMADAVKKVTSVLNVCVPSP